MKKGILLISFGTASMQGEDTLQNFAANVRALFPGTPLRWAFTSHLIRERLASGARRKSDSVGKALRRMAFERWSGIVCFLRHE